MLINQRGQSTAEYAILIAVVIAAIVGMQLYIKRGMQGKLRDMTDVYTQQKNLKITGDDTSVVSVGEIGKTAQYEPYYTAEGALTTTTDNLEPSKMTQHGVITKIGIENSTTRTGPQQEQGVTLGKDNAWN